MAVLPNPEAGASTKPKETVAVIVPALNEERHIGECLETLIVGMRDRAGEILVMDGGSTDRTREVVLAMGNRYPQIRLVPNHGKLQSIGFNLGARVAEADATILIRADAHASYPLGFIDTCCHELRTHGATSVVVPMLTEGRAPMQRAIAAAQNSKLGNGGSAHRSMSQSRFVEHGHHAAFDRNFFIKIGGYDERFTHNEDAELDLRAVHAGGKIWMCCEAAMSYYPRETLSALFKQYMKHGMGRAKTVMLHHQKPKLRQLAPLIAFIGCVFGFAMSFWTPIFALIPFAYIGLCCGIGLQIAMRADDMACVATGPAAIVMHMGWAIGFIRGVVRFRRIEPRRVDGEICISPS